MNLLQAPRHRHRPRSGAHARAQPPTARTKGSEGKKDAILPVNDALVGGDAQELASRIQESMLASETAISTSSDISGGMKGTFVASSAAEWMDGLDLKELEMKEDLFEDEDEGESDIEDIEELHVNPRTGLSAGWTVSVPGQEPEDSEEPPSAAQSNSWSVTAMPDADFNEPGEESLQVSSRALRKVIGASESRETLDAKVVAVCRGLQSRTNFHDIEHEESLQSLKPHEIKQALKDQERVDESTRFQKPAEVKKRRLEQQRHIKLKIVAGACAGTRLYSPAGLQTRPMMEKVRGALFSMLLAGSAGRYAFPQSTRWLDLYAGTGAIGLEALSRGCGQAHFVEMDPWVVKKCLSPNIKATKLNTQCVVHQVKAESFLQRGRKAGSFAGGAFDFVSVTPPYMLVSYPEIFDLLENSPLIHDNSVVIVEYAKQNIKDIRRHLGSLSLIKSRRYGRTYIAVYGSNNNATL